MTAREKLISMENVYDSKGSSDIFMEAMRDCIKHHINNNEFYSRYMKTESFDPDELKTEEDLEKIPFMHANFFKKYVVLSVDESEIVEHVTSSGTSGQKSQMFFDKDTFDFGNKMVENEFRYFGFYSDERRTIFFLLMSPLK